MTSISPSPSARRSSTGPNRVANGKRRDRRERKRGRLERRPRRRDELSGKDAEPGLGLSGDRVELLAVPSRRRRGRGNARAVELGEHGRERGRLADVLGEAEERDAARARPRRSAARDSAAARHARGLPASSANARASAGWRRSRSRASPSWPGTKPLPIDKPRGLREALGAERGGREGRRHAEEDDGPVVPGAEDARGLGARGVGHVDDEVRERARRRRLDRLEHGDGIAGVDRKDLVGETESCGRGRRPPRPGSTARTRPLPPTASRAAARHRSPALPVPMTRTVCPACASRRTAAGAPATSKAASATSSGKSCGQPGEERPREENRRAAGLDPLGRRMHGADRLEGQRRQRQRDERRDRRAREEVPGGRVAGPDGRDLAEQHAARARDGVLHLAALAHDPGDLVADRLARRGLGLAELPERGGVDRERAHRDGDLVLERARRRVEPAGQLRQDARRIERAVEPERMGRRHRAGVTARGRRCGAGRPSRRRSSSAAR